MRPGVEPLSFSLEDVCFLHWPIAEAVVDGLVPDWLRPDIADETAWVSVLAFEIAQFDVFGLPVREGVEAIAVRTYVRSPGGDRGVYFISVDVTDQLAATAARRLFRLPYRAAAIERSATTDETTGTTRTTVRVTGRDRHNSAFAMTYEPTGPAQVASPDTLPSFLCERYRYFTEGPFGTPLGGNVGHDPWSLQSAVATVTETERLEDVGIVAPESEPLAHASESAHLQFEPPTPLAIQK